MAKSPYSTVAPERRAADARRWVEGALETGCKFVISEHGVTTVYRVADAMPPPEPDDMIPSGLNTAWIHAHLYCVASQLGTALPVVLGRAA